MQIVSRAFASSIIQRAAREGLELPAALVAAVRAAARVPLRLQDALWEAYCSADAVSPVGLRIGLQAPHLDSAGLQPIACDTLGEALHELVEVAPVIGEGGAFELSHRGPVAHLVYRPQLRVRAGERVEAMLASALNLARWATGARLRAAGLRFAHAPLASLPAYAALLDAPTQFGAAHNSLGFDAAQRALPLLGANAQLREHLRALTWRTLAELGRSSLAAALQLKLQSHPDLGRERMAAALGMSARHLVRRLAAQGLSFKALREAQLHDMACRALSGPQRIADIAAELGFAHEEAFVRAFRRWRAGARPARGARGRRSLPGS